MPERTATSVPGSLTPEEMARAVLMAQELRGLNGADFPERCEALITAVIRDAVAEEREACASLVAGFTPTEVEMAMIPYNTLDDIAEAIRSRS